MILVKVNEESFKMSVSSSRLGYYGECFATEVETTLAIRRLIGKGMAVMPTRM